MELFVTIVQAAAVLTFVVAMAWAAISDVRSFEVPNGVSIIVVLMFCVLALTGADGWAANLNNLATGVGVLIVGFALFASRLFGAGDVKLLAAISLWVGWPQLMAYLFLVALAGGLVSVFLILFRRRPLSPRLAAAGWIARLHSRGRDVPYAVAIAVPAVLFLPRMPLIAGIFG